MEFSSPLISSISSVREIHDPASSRDSRGATPRRKKDRGLQLHSLLTSRNNKRARMCRLGGTAISHLWRNTFWNAFFS